MRLLPKPFVLLATVTLVAYMVDSFESNMVPPSFQSERPIAHELRDKDVERSLRAEGEAIPTIASEERGGTAELVGRAVEGAPYLERQVAKIEKNINIMFKRDHQSQTQKREGALKPNRDEELKPNRYGDSNQNREQDYKEHLDFLKKRGKVLMRTILDLYLQYGSKHHHRNSHRRRDGVPRRYRYGIPVIISEQPSESGEQGTGFLPSFLGGEEDLSSIAETSGDCIGGFFSFCGGAISEVLDNI